MSMPSEAVETLHEITKALKAEHEARDAWMTANDEFDSSNTPKFITLSVTKAEGERIFADRIAAHESRLKELGWSRVVKVETNPIAQPRALNGEQS